MYKSLFVAGLSLAVAGIFPAAAQEPSTPADDVMTAVPDPDTVMMPALAFDETQADIDDYDKYFYFHRAGTSFEDALSDLRECDKMSRGLASSVQYQQAPYPYTYTMAGAVGGALGNAFAAAIVGSAQKRAKRRINMRRCMGYKGYGRYGLRKSLWEEFNFEEGLGMKEESYRQERLAIQAKVASGPKPAARELGL